MSNRNERILTAFCRGAAPSLIDRLMRLADGTARRVVVDWWYADRIDKRGCADTILGDGWCDFRPSHRDMHPREI